MRQLTRGMDFGDHEAISAFLDLGEKLRSRFPDEASGSALDRQDAHELLRAIEGDIVPRLLLAHRRERATAAPRGDGRAELTADDREQFLDCVRYASASAADELIAALLARGVPVETIFLDLLGGAARRLGELWERDLCDFTDVTIGLCRLHQMLRDHSVVHQPPHAQPAAEGPSVLLCTACADQHVFGVVMVAEFFRRAGWRVWSEPGAVRAEVASLLARQPFDLLGLSAACSAPVEEVASEIESFRRASTNRALRVLVGGRLFVEAPQLTEAVGADAMALDAESAPAAGREALERGYTAAAR